MAFSTENDCITQDVDSLIDICKKNIYQIHSEFVTEDKNSKEAQLKAIAKAIENLEKQKVEVPESLRAEKTKLVSELAIYDENFEKLKLFRSGLSGLIMELDTILSPLDNSTTNKKKNRKRSKLPKTDSATLQKYIIEALSKMGGSGTVSDILSKIELKLEGKMLPGDLELRQDGRTVVWRNNVQWQRMLMVKEGILRSDSPKGIWELNE
ncbi:MAG: hypothetical protein HQK65_15890 [Desulfamplus sp.]|nr:hypothetical protein [Desulfamplus sp.]